MRLCSRVPRCGAPRSGNGGLERGREMELAQHLRGERGGGGSSNGPRTHLPRSGTNSEGKRRSLLAFKHVLWRTGLPPSRAGRRERSYVWGTERREEQPGDVPTANEYPATVMSERGRNVVGTRDVWCSTCESSCVKRKRTELASRHEEEVVGQITYMCQESLEAERHGGL